ncbi:MAG: hypothetical protein WBA89_07915 [Microcoleus sp.]|uniref:hypothetical protein n=1 Tax=Microcoleus sp. TaxID=44472 RepID=UPI003C76AF57
MLILDGASKQRKISRIDALPEFDLETNKFFSGARSIYTGIRDATFATGRIFRSLVANYFLNLAGLAEAMRDIAQAVRPCLYFNIISLKYQRFIHFFSGAFRFPIE